MGKFVKLNSRGATFIRNSRVTVLSMLAKHMFDSYKTMYKIWFITLTNYQNQSKIYFEMASLSILDQILNHP